jgi:hypothetical protein
MIPTLNLSIVLDLETIKFTEGILIRPAFIQHGVGSRLA